VEKKRRKLKAATIVLFVMHLIFYSKIEVNHYSSKEESAGGKK
jgi:hypothetical protein